MDVPVEDFLRDILLELFVMNDQMWINRLFNRSDMFAYSGSDISTCFTDMNRVAARVFDLGNILSLLVIVGVT